MKSIHLFCLVFLFSLNLSAQRLNVPTISPASELKQEIGLTEITLKYARPSAKGRAVFGELVPFGEIWRTGANASTKLTFSEGVKIGGNSLPAGTYALYTIPGYQEWTIIIHKKTNMRSIAGGKVKEENDAFRFNVKPINNPISVETFTIEFTDLSTQACNVQISWENTIVKFPIEVDVDSKILAQMEEFMKTPEKTSHGVYFHAAEYNLHNQKDLDQAMKWINIALEKSENNFRYGLLKSKIYTAKGDKEMAVSTVETANAWASAAKNANYMKQTSVYLASIEKGENKASLNNEQYAKDVSSLDNIMVALYDVISGDKGVKRDWDRFRNLFIDEARLIPSGKGKDGKISYRIMTPEDYIQNSGKWLEENGFHEIGIKNKVEEYGSLVHVYSTYESYHAKADEKPFTRGINSIQLMNDGNRWWIIQIYWLGETKDLTLPKKYLLKD